MYVVKVKRRSCSLQLSWGSEKRHKKERKKWYHHLRITETLYVSRRNIYNSRSGIINIPRSTEDRESLARNGLIGKIRLTTDREIRKEITSVFSSPMKGDSLFDFKISSFFSVLEEKANTWCFPQFLLDSSGQLLPWQGKMPKHPSTFWPEKSWW